MQLSNPSRVLFFFAVLALTCAQLKAENWPQWRGPRNDAVSTEKNIPAKWSTTQNIAWSMQMPGMSGATPVVWGDRIFVSSADENKDLLLLCISTDGKLIWKQKVSTGDRHARGDGNMASPTPSTDGKHVWVFYGTGDFACFDFAGKQIWKTNLQQRYGRFKMGFGMHTTPVLFGDRIYMQLIHSGAALVLAFDKATGQEVWIAERKSDGVAECEHSYASPMIWQKGDAAYLVTHGNDYAIGHSLKDGKEIWRLGDLNPKSRYNRTLRFVATPVATPDLIVIPTAKRGAVVGLNPAAKGYVSTGHQSEIWRMRSGTPDVPAPVVHNGLVYLCTEGGDLICLDAKTGTQNYKEKAGSGRHRASPVYADGKIYTVAASGTVSVIKAGPKFELISRNTLDGTLTASPAISGGRIYLRTWTKLYAVGKK